MRYVSVGTNVIDTKGYHTIATAITPELSKEIAEAMNEKALSSHVCTVCGCLNDGSENKCWACDSELLLDKTE